MVLNPPRKGIQAAALEAVLAAGAPRIIYVRASRAAWRAISTDWLLLIIELSRFSLFDMFPQTEEVETLVLLRKMMLRRTRACMATKMPRANLNRVKDLQY